MTPEQILISMAKADFRRKCPNVPEHAAPVFRYRDTTANGLTRMIIDYIKLSGGMAERVNSMGIYDPEKRQFRPSGSKKGTADISAIFNGRSLRIEVKMSRDKLSEHQKKYACETEAAGGFYFEARNFDDFFFWINSNFNRK